MKQSTRGNPAFLTPEDFNPAIGGPPIAEQKHERREYHGRTLDDPYGWLRDPGYPEVRDPSILDYLRRENSYFDEAMSPRKERVDALFRELKGRLEETETSVPVKDGGWLFWWRFPPGEEYREHLRRPVDGGEEELLLSEPELARGREYFRLGGMEVSYDGSYLAYSTDFDGSERYTLRFERLDGGETSATSETIPGTIGDPVWLPDNRSVLYLELSEEWRPYRLRAHTLGTDPREDPILYEETDPSFFVDLDLSQSREYIILASGDHETTEIRVAASESLLSKGSLRLLLPRHEGVEEEIDHAGDYFYRRTNDTYKNFRLLRAPVDRPESWEELIPGSEEIYLRGITAFDGFLVLEERVNGIDRLRLKERGGEERVIPFPEEIYSAQLGANPEFSVDRVRISYQSMITPPTVYDYRIADRRLETKKVKEIPSGYERSRYRSERLSLPGRDGTEVPVSVVYREETPLDGSAPLYLYGYGAYGYGITPHFSTNALSLLDRGFVVAVAHVRGGDELGYRWYEAGKRNSRKNTFYDFVDVARGLIDRGYTDVGGICARGGSAGGELMGAAVNIAPELFRAVVAEVPFVDVLNTMLDDTLPLTPIEWPEWGNPIEDPDAFDYILSYSPYDNVVAQEYPPLLITAGISDPRVTYWEPAKWAAKLRATKTDNNVLLLKTNMGAGHGGRSGRYSALYEDAEAITFMLLASGLA